MIAKSDSNGIAPIEPTERIIALDALRGFAVLGILLMNIQSFAMIQAAYLNPTALGDLVGLNKWVWIFSHVFADQKFMTLFSILFGAGIILMTSKTESKGMKAAGLHYRRTFWLLCIGLVHAYLLWYGDILVVYAFCSLVAFLFRKLSPKVLLITGLLIVSVSSILYLFFGLSIGFWPPEAINETMTSWQPEAAQVAKEIAAYQGGWLGQMELRVPASLEFHTFIFLIWAGWRAGGLMLIGMALYKWGVLTGNFSKKTYLLMMSFGLLIGLPVVSYGVFANFEANWTLEFSMFLGSQFNYWGSLFVGMGYIGAAMLIFTSGFAEKITRLFADVGRMALTNYLSQTLICVIIFYGYGFGLFATVERKIQILIVLGIWLFQLIASKLWLRYFQFGPAEWLWRTLTYFNLQPMRRM